MSGPGRFFGGSCVACALVAVAAVVLACGSGPRAARQDSREWFVETGRSGTGTAIEPFGTIEAALAVAGPGDRVSVRAGTYREKLRTQRGGEQGRAIVVVAGAGPGSVTLSESGRVLTIDHPFIVFDGFIFDGDYGLDDTLLLTDRASNVTLRNCEVRRSSRDLIDIRGPHDVLIENCLIHHALDSAGGRTDAHGIGAGPARNLTIRDTEIHTFSGDGLQIDPGRRRPGWNGVVVERTKIWLAPLETAENGFESGTVPGENAIDTKADPSLPRSSLTIRDTEAFGFRDGLIPNMAAFNLKENVAVTLDAVTVSKSEIAFRLRGPTGRPAAGAEVTVTNTVVYDVGTAFRYENDLPILRVWNTTIGAGVERPFQPASSRKTVIDLRNVLMLRAALPRLVAPPYNRAVGPEEFRDASAHQYQLTPRSSAIDAGMTIGEIGADRSGVKRPQGGAYDLGAYEHTGGRASPRTSK
jgi:hypothetical protein